MSLTLRSLAARALVMGVALGPWAMASTSRADGPAKFTLTIPKVSAKKGQPAKAVVQIKPATGYHLNLEYPTSLKLSPPAGVTAAKIALTKQDAKLAESEGSFTVEVTSADAGDQSVPGELRFAVCTATICEPQRAPVAFALEVK